jgi:hypothetical protein
MRVKVYAQIVERCLEENLRSNLQIRAMGNRRRDEQDAIREDRIWYVLPPPAGFACQSG